ncbi:hypothetical protein PAAG_11115 [Paracoccidioides lutzii Pb01]|uniref:Uncharacterized protein n=1 Tax=Paracoccidioides lutzii (strain ATCC MYA-826 / Pb01) TaxID=502779 RepID=A0A0A2V7Y1_PARBA|nr:hypothetical protein PAAG_11115 [Paracoccidioides lutzii Pb01]KGQ02160.1 hypothetical protein PAAG_11115 [Paracoccidioides lutzii Pb01]
MKVNVNRVATAETRRRDDVQKPSRLTQQAAGSKAAFHRTNELIMSIERGAGQQASEGPDFALLPWEALALVVSKTLSPISFQPSCYSSFNPPGRIKLTEEQTPEPSKIKLPWITVRRSHLPSFERLSSIEDYGNSDISGGDETCKQSAERGGPKSSTRAVRLIGVGVGGPLAEISDLVGASGLGDDQSSGDFSGTTPCCFSCTLLHKP